MTGLEAADHDAGIAGTLAPHRALANLANLAKRAMAGASPGVPLDVPTEVQ